MTNTSQRGSRITAPGNTAARDRSRTIKGMVNTIPIVLVGSMALSLNLTGPIHNADPKSSDEPRTTPAELGKTIRKALARAAESAPVDGTSTTAPVTSVATSVPGEYRVASGDTISSIAGKYGLATASVLALNGLGWNTVIFPGQTLRLAKIETGRPFVARDAIAGGHYTIASGDTISAIAARFHVSTQSILTANGLSASSIIYPGQTVTIPRVAPAAFAPAPVSHVRSIAAPTKPNTADITSSYVIRPGDTLSKIATKFEVSIQSILNANDLRWSSIIYAGRSLTIPSATVLTTTTSAPTSLTAEMASNARTVISVGRSLGVNDYGLVIALSAAMQESGLRNLNYGDRDSLGMFQQRPSAGWGTPAQIRDTHYASRLFFGGQSNPNHGNTQGLLDINGWQSMTVTQAAQAVQLSAFPYAYAKWESSAWVWLDLLQ